MEENRKKSKNPRVNLALLCFFFNSFFIFTLSVAMFVFCPLHQLRKLALKISKYINLVSEVDEAKNREHSASYLFENRACTRLPEQVEEMLLLLSSFLQWMRTETDQCKIEGDILLIFHFGVLTK